ncbi:MAG TPA: nucleotidyl transferase AbiEii/AbiGii toxin family protein [Thermoanaerobaculia bacterium]|jgi:hypothetical protein|nr:nucleotidyl transferase AbiEii/AbiGii toxin family protein [Thermoanaerobaculia bacterium]
MSALDVVVDTLEEKGIPFALIGATALAAHGIARATLDIDFLVPRHLAEAWAAANRET